MRVSRQLATSSEMLPPRRGSPWEGYRFFPPTPGTDVICRIHGLGDASLRLWQAGNIGKDRLVSKYFGRLRFGRGARSR